MKNIKITVGTCAYLSHAFKYVCSQYGVTSCQGEHKMKIRSLSVLVAMILLIGCYSPVAKVDAAEKNYKKALRIIDKADSTHDLKKAYALALKEIEKTEIDENREVLNVDITGEIFLVNDEFSNQNIERELGKMGVQTRRSLTVGSFLKDAIIPKAFRPPETHLQRAERMAKPYLMRDIGGDALECVSDVVFADEKGKDGIIHISPFTCMPEIMSQNIFPTMREDHEIPILTLIMDEQTGKAGYITRLEAFVDLMRRKKRAKLGKLKTRI